MKRLVETGLTCRSLLEMADQTDSVDKSILQESITREETYLSLSKQWHELYLDDLRYAQQHRHLVDDKAISNITAHTLHALPKLHLSKVENEVKQEDEVRVIPLPQDTVKEEVVSILQSMVDKIASDLESSAMMIDTTMITTNSLEITAPKDSLSPPQVAIDVVEDKIEPLLGECENSNDGLPAGSHNEVQVYQAEEDAQKAEQVCEETELIVADSMEADKSHTEQENISSSQPPELKAQQSGTNANEMTISTDLLPLQPAVEACLAHTPSNPVIPVSARERAPMNGKVAIDLSYLASESVFPVDYFTQQHSLPLLFSFCDMISSSSADHAMDHDEDEELGQWTAESYDFMSWIDEETIAIQQAEQARIEAEEEEKRRKRKEQYEQRKEMKLKKKQEEAEKRRQKYLEKKLQKQVPDEEEQEAEDGLEERSEASGQKRKRSDSVAQDEEEERGGDEEVNLETIFNEEWFEISGRRKTRQLKQQEAQQKEEILAMAKKQLELEKAFKRQKKTRTSSSSFASHFAEHISTLDGSGVNQSLPQAGGDITPAGHDQNERMVEEVVDGAEEEQTSEEVILLPDLDCAHWEHQIVQHTISSEVGKVIKFYDAPPRNGSLRPGKPNTKMVDVRTLWGVMTGYDYHFKLLDETSEEYMRFIDGNILLEADVGEDTGADGLEEDTNMIQDMIQEATMSYQSISNHHQSPPAEEEEGTEWQLFDQLDHVPEAITSTTITATNTNPTDSAPSVTAVDETSLERDTNATVSTSVATTGEGQAVPPKPQSLPKSKFLDRPSKIKLVDILPPAENNGPKKIPKKQLKRADDDNDDHVGAISSSHHGHPPALKSSEAIPSSLSISSVPEKQQPAVVGDGWKKKETFSTVHQPPVGKQSSLPSERNKLEVGNPRHVPSSGGSGGNVARPYKPYSANANTTAKEGFHHKFGGGGREEYDRQTGAGRRDKADLPYDKRELPGAASSSSYGPSDRYESRSRYPLSQSENRPIPGTGDNKRVSPPRGKPLAHSTAGEVHGLPVDTKTSGLVHDPRLSKRAYLSGAGTTTNTNNNSPPSYRNKWIPSGNVTPRFSSDEEEDITTSKMATSFSHSHQRLPPGPPKPKNQEEEDDDEDVKNLFQQLKSSMTASAAPGAATTNSHTTEISKTTTVTDSKAFVNPSNPSQIKNATLVAKTEKKSDSSAAPPPRRSGSRFDRPGPVVPSTSSHAMSSSSTTVSGETTYRSAVTRSASPPQSKTSYPSRPTSRFSKHPAETTASSYPNVASTRGTAGTSSMRHEVEEDVITASAFHVTMDYDLPTHRNHPSIYPSEGRYGDDSLYDQQYPPVAYPNEDYTPLSRPYDHFDAANNISSYAPLPLPPHRGFPPSADDYSPYLPIDEISGGANGSGYAHHEYRRDRDYHGDEYYDAHPVDHSMTTSFDDPYLQPPAHSHRDPYYDPMLSPPLSSSSTTRGGSFSSTMRYDDYEEELLPSAGTGVATVAPYYPSELPLPGYEVMPDPYDPYYPAPLIAEIRHDPYYEHPPSLPTSYASSDPYAPEYDDYRGPSMSHHRVADHELDVYPLPLHVRGDGLYGNDNGNGNLRKAGDTTKPRIPHNLASSSSLAQGKKTFSVTAEEGKKIPSKLPTSKASFSNQPNHYNHHNHSSNSSNNNTNTTRSDTKPPSRFSDSKPSREEQDATQPLKLVNVPKKKPPLQSRYQQAQGEPTPRNNPFLQSSSTASSSSSSSGGVNSLVPEQQAHDLTHLVPPLTPYGYGAEEVYGDYGATGMDTTAMTAYDASSSQGMFDPMISSSTIMVEPTAASATAIVPPVPHPLLFQPVPFQPINNRTKHQTKEILAKQRQQYDDFSQFLQYSTPAVVATSGATALPLSADLLLTSTTTTSMNPDYATLTKAERRRLKRKEKLLQSQATHVQSIHSIDQAMDAIGNELMDVQEAQDDDDEGEEDAEDEANGNLIKKVLNPEDLEDGEVDE